MTSAIYGGAQVVFYMPTGGAVGSPASVVSTESTDAKNLDEFNGDEDLDLPM